MTTTMTTAAVVSPAPSVSGTDATDAADGDSSPSSSTNRDEIRDRLAALLAQEPRYRCREYLRPASKAALRRGAKRRSIVVRWLFDAVTSLGLPRETATIAAGYLDRYLASSSPRGRRARRRDAREYQLAALTCLYVAAKVRPPLGQRGRLDAGALGALARGAVTAEDIARCEKEVLMALKWRVNGPTVGECVRCLLELLPDGVGSEVAQRLSIESQWQTELAVEDYACVILKRSTIAIAAVLNSLAELSEDDFSLEERARFVRTVSMSFAWMLILR